MTLRRITCTQCQHLMAWSPEVFKNDEPGFVLKCPEPDCAIHGKTQDFILLSVLTRQGVNPLGHFGYILPEA